MILELHLIQNFAPSNLNRSDTGSPKDCTFGGFRRARISSQCFKRAMREHFRENFSAQDNLAERSTRLVEAISKHLIENGKDEAEAKGVVETALSGVGLKMSSKDATKTQYLLFLGREEIKEVADVCLENYDALLKITPKTEEGMTAKEAKKAAKGSVPPEISKALKNVLDGGKASDLALFGRMLADLPDKTRDASSQVAHAISTHKVGMEFDFFTAVDDLKPEEQSGSDHLGTVEFNSACFYRYANVNIEKLKDNLQGDEDLTRATIEAFIRSAIEAIPTGKQNSFATHERPSFVLAVVGDAGKCSLANAFEKPVKASEKKGLVESSIENFAAHWEAIAEIYGDDAKAKNCFKVKTADVDLKSLKNNDAGNVETLINNTMKAIFA
ncbi:MAG: type I-E CRISPR-associated protein Cas7/Cse4/CasC [Pyrinomonadaceae bacterium]|nr:type I-E CRISPR-associated protein Cas7/Cse4/CasC [Pyrinomonadaceae bacterium]